MQCPCVADGCGWDARCWSVSAWWKRLSARTISLLLLLLPRVLPPSCTRVATRDPEQRPSRTWWNGANGNLACQTRTTWRDVHHTRPKIYLVCVGVLSIILCLDLSLTHTLYLYPQALPRVAWIQQTMNSPVATESSFCRMSNVHGVSACFRAVLFQLMKYLSQFVFPHVDLSIDSHCAKPVLLCLV